MQGAGAQGVCPAFPDGEQNARVGTDPHSVRKEGARQETFLHTTELPFVEDAGPAPRHPSPVKGNLDSSGKYQILSLGG